MMVRVAPPGFFFPSLKPGNFPDRSGIAGAFARPDTGSIEPADKQRKLKLRRQN
jgi:hypothetical protein